MEPLESDMETGMCLDLAYIGTTVEEHASKVFGHRGPTSLVDNLVPSETLLHKV